MAPETTGAIFFCAALLLRDLGSGCPMRPGADVQLAGRGWIGHLLLEDLEAHGAGLQRGPVRSGAEDGLVLADDLVIEDVDAAGKIPLRVQDGLLRIVRGQVFICLPIEGAAIPLAVFVSELQQAPLGNDSTPPLT